MPKRLLVLLLLTLMLLPVGATHRALLVGVGNYPPNSGWPRLNSANDIALLEPEMQQHGIEVTTLLDAQATKAGIVKAIKHLTRQSRPGDRVWLHFSGHGQQVEDSNGDENDGLDEAFVPYDAMRYLSKTYHGQNHFTDDDLNPLLVTLRKQVGPRGEVLVTIDACHSGDSYRDADKAVVTDTVVGTRRGASNVLTKNQPYVRRQPSTPMRITPLKRSDGYAAVAVLGACQPDECNYEYAHPSSRRSYGALSYTLWEALSRTKQHPRLADIAHWVMRYESFYMRKYQNPHLYEE